jgi:regulator of protease activity HflC (stomatin/prohibitin superfamily)
MFLFFIVLSGFIGVILLIVQTARKVAVPEIKKQIMFTMLGVILIGLLLSSIKTVGTGRIAVITRFGKVTGRELGEGAHMIFPFDRANVYDIRVQKETAAAKAASKDLQDINSELVINYRIKPGEVSNIHRTIGPEYSFKLIEPAVQEVFKATTAKYDATQLITDRASVKAEAQKLLVNRLSKYGIIVVDISITNFSFSDDFSKAIEAKQVAQQNAERAKFNLEASRIDAEAQQAQSATLSELYLKKQAIEKWDGKMPNYIGGGSVFNIPLQ